MGETSKKKKIVEIICYKIDLEEIWKISTISEKQKDHVVHTYNKDGEFLKWVL